MVQIQTARQAGDQLYQGPIRPDLTLINGQSESIVGKEHAMDEYLGQLGKKGLFIYLEGGNPEQVVSMPQSHEIEAAVMLHSASPGYKSPFNSGRLDRIACRGGATSKPSADAELEAGYAGEEYVISQPSFLETLLRHKKSRPELDEAADAALKKANRAAYVYSAGSDFMIGQDRILGGIILSRTGEQESRAGIVLAYPLMQEARNLLPNITRNLSLTSALAAKAVAKGVSFHKMPELTLVD